MSKSNVYSCRLSSHESQIIEEIAAKSPLSRAEILRRAFRFYAARDPDNLPGLLIRDP